jgi:hypothetical protein
VGNLTTLQEKGVERNKVGRPPSLAPDDKTLEMLRTLRAIQCTVEEAAAVLGVHRATLHDFLVRHPEAREAWDCGAAEGRISLRRQQFEMAKTNPAMAIFLGKNHLGQSDRRELSGPGGRAIPLDIDVTRLSEKQLEQLEVILVEALGD